MKHFIGDRLLKCYLLSSIFLLISFLSYSVRDLIFNAGLPSYTEFSSNS